MKTSSSNSLNKHLQSQNSLSSVDTIESPIQMIEKKQPKKYTQRFLQSNVLSKQDLRQFIAQDSFSSKYSLRRLDSYNLSENGSPSETNISIPVKTNNFFMNQQQKPSYHKKNQISAAQQEIFDEELNQNMNPQYFPSQYASQNQFSSIDDEFENESDSDEHNIWDNSDAHEMGIDVEDSDITFEFCQLYYIRSQLFQENRVSKSNVLDEVQVISRMCKKQMDMNVSKQLVDLIENYYHLSEKKKAMQLAKIEIEKANKQAQSSMFLKNSAIQRLSQPKQFRISKLKGQAKSPSIPNILEQDFISSYQGNQRRLIKSNTNLKINSIETVPVMKQNSQHDIPSSTLSTVKKVNLNLNSPQKQSSSKGFESEKVRYYNIFNNLGKTMSHLHFKRQLISEENNLHIKSKLQVV